MSLVSPDTALRRAVHRIVGVLPIMYRYTVPVQLRPLDVQQFVRAIVDRQRHCRNAMQYSCVCARLEKLICTRKVMTECQAWDKRDSGVPVSATILNCPSVSYISLWWYSTTPVNAWRGRRRKLPVSPLKNAARLSRYDTFCLCLLARRSLSSASLLSSKLL